MPPPPVSDMPDLPSLVNVRLPTWFRNPPQVNEVKDGRPIAPITPVGVAYCLPCPLACARACDLV